ncbi:MAG: glucuronate isomerase, partial [Kiritimatiellae bacterium]|nr:glucuronate isomerase [Kiritimatiellia bacterium]
MKDFNDIYSVVKDLPIIDWHNHLDMKLLAEDKPLGSLYEVWVKADPYKHRAMRICGEPERLITGDATESEKWEAWKRTLPKLIGNPLFAWAKMEIEWLDFFNAESQSSRESRWWRNVENISLSGWTPSKMLKAFNVECICPCVGVSELDSLQVSGRAGGSQPAAADSRSFGRAACPQAAAARWGQRALPLSIIPSLRMNAGDEITVEDLERFAAVGCRVVDISVDDASQLSTHYAQLSTVASFAAAHGWTMLLHLGALRSTSERLRAAAGPAGGFAGMRAPVDPAAVASFLNRLEHGRAGCPQPAATDSRSFGRAGCPQPAAARWGQRALPELNTSLPRTILLSLNPEAHAQLAVLSGSFVEDGMPGKVQLGPAWWWCDHEEGIRDVLEKNAAYGVLSTFIGMTTDSRSLLSFVRHDYFRRILC